MTSISLREWGWKRERVGLEKWLGRWGGLTVNTPIQNNCNAKSEQSGTQPICWHTLALCPVQKGCISICALVTVMNVPRTTSEVCNVFDVKNVLVCQYHGRMQYGILWHALNCYVNSMVYEIKWHFLTLFSNYQSVTVLVMGKQKCLMN